MALSRNRCLAGNTGKLPAREKLHVPGCTFPFRIFRSCRGAPELGDTNSDCVRKRYSAQPLPSPFPSHPFPSFPPRTNSTWGGKPWNSPARFTSKWEARFLLVMQRVKAIQAPSFGERGPQRRRALGDLLSATGLARPLPLSLRPPLLCAPCTPLKCAAGSVRAQLGFGSLTPARGP